MRPLLLLLCCAVLLLGCRGEGVDVADASTGDGEDGGVTERQRAKCEAAEEILVNRSMTLTGSRVGKGNDFFGSNLPACSDGAGDDVVLKLVFPAPTNVSMRLDTTGWAMLQLRRECTRAVELACGNETWNLFGHSPADFSYSLDSGTYYAIVDAEEGGATYSLSIGSSWSQQAADKCAAAPKVMFDGGGRWSVNADTTGASLDFLGSLAGGCDDGRAAEHLYEVTLAEHRRLKGRIATQTDWGILELRDGCPTGPAVACGNEYKALFAGKVAGRFDVLAPPGTYHLIADSEFDAGVYWANLDSIAYTRLDAGATCADAPAITRSGNYGGTIWDKGHDELLSCGSDGGRSDVHLRLDLSERSLVSADPSVGLIGQTVVLRSGCGSAEELVCSRDAVQALDLDAGSYWFTVELSDERFVDAWWLSLDIQPVTDDGGVIDAGIACGQSCAAGTYCLDGSCDSCTAGNRCGPGCTLCPSSTPYCNAAGTTCVACRTSGQCPVVTPCCTVDNVCEPNIVGCQ